MTRFYSIDRHKHSRPHFLDRTIQTRNRSADARRDLSDFLIVFFIFLLCVCVCWNMELADGKLDYKQSAQGYSLRLDSARIKLQGRGGGVNCYAST